MRLRLVLLALPVFCIPLVAADLSGEWKVDATFDDASRARGWPEARGELVCTLKTDNGRVTGDGKPLKAARGVPVAGELKGENIRWQFDVVIQPGAAPVQMIYTGRLDQAQTAVRGTFALADFGGDFTAKKQ